ncbi:hypothetical protein COU78_01500 [Candidatus Peregrinibacteria bacterium CG10_big_fil_rev_8_21_14_0_10_49_24]|nr:MAG: hypothetical protein COU78_01500 [Candidatus Peregrinibacteria bacterium CG10_big_fil_rev_8_21_14_0_10_49_24]PJA67315.1 MAG: hypothetical protein CO157_05270 [Candidatus Peregrinibacteria bacterium CG_4_9_14_3_um_filter_49_12]
MGIRDDDEDLFISRSNEDAFKNPEKAKRDAREQKAKQEGKLLDLKRQMLLQQVSAQNTHSALADQETKRLQKLNDDAKQKEVFGTKTHKQLEEESMLDAQTQVTAEQQIDADAQAEEKKEQAKQEYQNEDG